MQADSQWCYPEQGSYKMRMREVFKDYGRFKKQANLLKKEVIKNFTAEKQYKMFCDSIYKQEDFDVESWLENLDEKVA